MTHFTARDHAFMSRAVQLARRGWYSTHPNPRVGCLIVKNGQVLAEGWHEQAGQAHAEIMALQQAGSQAQGAVVYVSLEPCAHQGRTPPCVEALIAAKVAEVKVAMIDPNPRVAGAGLARLQAAGIVVQQGLLAPAAAALNPGFIKRMHSGLPWLRVKSAMSLDGRTALSNGVSQWISSPAARRDVQFWRAQSSAVMTGIDTVLADDPSLNLRLSVDDLAPVAVVRQPVRIILDTQLRLPLTAKLLQLPGPVWVCTASDDRSKRDALAERGVTLIQVPKNATGHLDLQAVMSELATREINEIQLEAGPRLSGACIQAGLVDELLCYLAPRLLGDAARGLVHLPEFTDMQQSITLQLSDQRQLGDDLRLTYRVLRKA